MNRKAGTSGPQAVVEAWLDRDLSAAAAADQLPPAFEVDDVLDQVLELLAARRFPILTGASGIGKSAAIYELVRRAHQGLVPPWLADRRFVQFSLQRHACAAGFTKSHQIAAAMHKLVEALAEIGDGIVPFFADLHAAYRLDLEPSLMTLGMRFPGVVLAEGDAATVAAMLEMSPGLDEFYAIVNVEEPGFEKTGRILHAWSAARAATRARPFMPEALDQALHLTHRFDPRAHQPRKALDLLGQLASVGPVDCPVAESDVVERFCAQHKTPRALVDPACPLDLGELERRFGARVLGQPEAVRAMVNLIGQIAAGLSDVRRPFGVYLFVGPTGVGKTHVAQFLAEHLFGSKERMIRLNMADYATEAAADELFGYAHASNRNVARGVLTQRLIGHPFCVLLLDEFEKANTRVHDRFFQLVDEGCFINAVGENISCRSTIVIATTNAGAEVYRGQAFGFSGKSDLASQDREIDLRLEKHFRFEFLNRFDQIVHFHPLSREAIRTIALREMEQFQERSGIRQRRLALEIDEDVLDWLAVHGYDPNYGARFLRRTIERHVTTALADTIARHRPTPGTRITLTVRADQIVARLPVALPAPAPRETLALPVGTTDRVLTLDAATLRQEAEHVLAGAADKLARLEEEKRARSALLARMNDAAFWDRSAERAEVLERFRRLDVAIRVEERLAATICRLVELREQFDRGAAPLAQFARGTEHAAQALREWHDRLAEEGPAAVWVVLSNLDPLRPAAGWLSDLAEMELAWCARVHLAAQVVACESVNESLTRVALSAEGPGAAGYLAMEHGVHRMVRHPEHDWRAALEVIPQQAAGAGPWPEVVRMRSKSGPLNLAIDCRGRVELPRRGLAVDWLGTYGDLFAHFLNDVHAAWTQPPAGSLDTARLYGEAGRGAVDHRTGVAVSRIKDVLKGRLDPFLEGWRRQALAERGTDDADAGREQPSEATTLPTTRPVG
jgi:ATP-dependent Clp protease ATP-binding subunit ClpA